MAYFIFGYFSTKLGTSVDGQEINGREPILSKMCINTANVQEKNVILHYKAYYFGKICATIRNFSLPKKLDLRKNKLFRDRPSSFCSRYPNMCDRTKKNGK
jgi:hypothetical protein